MKWCRALAVASCCLCVGWLPGCESHRAASRGTVEEEQRAPAGLVTAQQELRWPAEDPDGAAGAIIDRIAEALRIDGNTGGGPEMPPIVERRSSRQLVVRFDLTDQLRGDAAGSDAAFRYSWTATPGTGAVVILARSEYV
ncbi:hypothetical protein MNBD_PLANCTO03-1017, partial [hydrothermal vent metagenome]